MRSSCARIAWAAALLLACWPAVVSASSGAVVELVTIGPEKPIEMRFGHILLRVIDEEVRRDDTYDFGVGPFHRPLFVLETMLGRGMFSLRRSPAQVRFNQYWLQDREVKTQRLNLNDQQLRDLQERLATNLLPENVEYRYDHVLDNCATRLRDLLDAVTDGSLRRAADEMSVSRSYREDFLVAGSGWLPALVGYDWAAGRHSEDPIGAWERAFLPEHLASLVGAAQNPALGPSAPLVAFDEVLHAREAAPAVGGSVSEGRQLVIAVGVALGSCFAVSGLAARRNRLARPVGRCVAVTIVPLSLVFGIIGLVMLPVRIFSSGFIFSENENALLLLPFDLLLLGPALRWIRSGRPQWGRLCRVYLNLRLLPIAAMAIGVGGQQNGAFVVAVGCIVVGLRCLPPASPAPPR